MDRQVRQRHRQRRAGGQRRPAAQHEHVAAVRGHVAGRGELRRRHRQRAHLLHADRDLLKAAGHGCSSVSVLRAVGLTERDLHRRGAGVERPGDGEPAAADVAAFDDPSSAVAPVAPGGRSTTSGPPTSTRARALFTISRT